MQWFLPSNDEGTQGTSFNIPPENIDMMMMHNDYSDSLMPIIYVRLILDKKNIDKMIQNAKKAVIYMNLFKKQKPDSTTDTTEYGKMITNYSGEMSYFISKDINYNADIDYTGEQNENREDIFETFSLGLMFKECIEANKQTNNTTLIKTDPFNSVLSFMQSTPALIEQFTYNEPFDQLIVPPQDSLYKTVDFFNNIAVFYDTAYRFYIEPGCIYLQSSSGNPVPKEGDKYDTVFFDIRKITDEESAIPGMSDDDEGKFHRVEIHVKDTEYNMDNNTTKLFNQISTIIDPSKNNTIVMLDQVNSVMNRITGLVDKVKGQIKSSISDIKNIPSHLFDYNGLFVDNTDSSLEVIAKIEADLDKGIDIVSQIPTDKDSGGKCWINKDIKEKALQDLQKYRAAVATSKGDTAQIPSSYSKSYQLLTSSMGKITGLGGCFGGVSPINVSDNLNATIKTLVSAKTELSEHNIAIQNDLMPKVNSAQSIITNTNESINIFVFIIDHYGEGSIGSDDPLGLVIESLRFEVKDLSKYLDEISVIVGKYKGEHVRVKSLSEAIEPTLKEFDTFKTDVKSEITGIVSDIRSIGDTARKSLDKIMNSARDIANSVNSLDFSIDSIQDLQKDINIVRDISKIGRLGISSFSASLNVGDGEDGTGSKIIRVENDNVNIIKNVKSHIENHLNVLTLHKNGLDTTVFTPNKRYIIKNYDAHSDKNGVFLLNKKIDMFFKHGGVFECNTRMEFSKIADESNQKDGSAMPRSLEGKDWVDIVENAHGILDRQRSEGISLNNLNDILDNAQAIQDIFNKNRN